MRTMSDYTKYIIKVPKDQIMTIYGVIDISNHLRHSHALKDLINMRFDFVGLDDDI